MSKPGIDDFRIALRQWRRAPATTALAILSLALAIGGTLALFSLVDTLLLKPLPLPHAHELARVVGRDPGWETPRDIAVPTHVWEYLAREQALFASTLALATDRVNLARGGEARHVGIAYVSGNYFDALGLDPTHGRSLVPSDDEPGGATVAVISHGLWQREFGAGSVVGQPLYLDGHRFDIVGVAPRGFFGLEVGRVDDVIVPLSAQDVIRGSSSHLRQPSSAWLQIYARLSPSVPLADVRDRLGAWYPAVRAATQPAGVAAARHLPYAFDLVPAAQGRSLVRDAYRGALAALLAAVVLLLVLACLNLAVLASARVAERRQEIGVRLSLGASRLRVWRLLMVEILLLALAGGISGLWLGVSLATAVVPLLSTTSLAGETPQMVLALDGRLLAAAAGLVALAALTVGAGPAWRVADASPMTTTAPDRLGRSRDSVRAVRWLSAAQVTLSVVLVVAALLFVGSFRQLTSRPRGLDTDHVLVAAVTDPFDARSPNVVLQRVERTRAALATVPGVESVSAGLVTPLGGRMAAAALTVPGSLASQRPGGFPPFNWVLPGYFTVLGTPLLAGRDFTMMDLPLTAGRRSGAALVNQSFARQHFGGFNPIGRSLLLGDHHLEIVGVVANARAMSLSEPRDVAMAYGTLAQRPTVATPSLRWVIRARRPDAVRPRIVNALRILDPRIAVELRTLHDDALRTVSRERLLAWLSGAFASLGLAIAALGIYSTFAHAVTRRRREIGVRVALGASRRDVAGLVVREAAILTLAGIGAGLAAAVATGRWIAALLFAIAPAAATTLATAAGIVILAVAAATLVPLRQASRVTPAEILRET